MKSCFFILALSLSVASSAGARMFRTAQLPNGSTFGCANCHINSGGGGATTSFGSQIQAGYLDNDGNVLWGPALAHLDADNDQFSNGLELQDPAGAWIKGQTSPGDKSLVSNPGNASSVPPETMIEDRDIAGLDGFVLSQNYPNPFNGSTTIRFELKNPASISLTVFNIQGKLVDTLINQKLEPGIHQVVWQGCDKNGEMVSSGVYLYCMESRNFHVTGSMLYIR